SAPSQGGAKSKGSRRVWNGRRGRAAAPRDKGRRQSAERNADTGLAPPAGWAGELRGQPQLAVRCGHASGRPPRGDQAAVEPGGRDSIGYDTTVPWRRRRWKWWTSYLLKPSGQLRLRIRG